MRSKQPLFPRRPCRRLFEILLSHSQLYTKNPYSPTYLGPSSAHPVRWPLHFRHSPYLNYLRFLFPFITNFSSFPLPGRPKTTNSNRALMSLLFPHPSTSTAQAQARQFPITYQKIPRQPPPPSPRVARPTTKATHIFIPCPHPHLSHHPSFLIHP